MKQRLFDASSEDAIQSRGLYGKPCRMLRGGPSHNWAYPDTNDAFLQTLLTVEARLRIKRAGLSEHMSYPVGQIVGDMPRKPVSVP